MKDSTFWNEFSKNYDKQIQAKYAEAYRRDNFL